MTLAAAAALDSVLAGPGLAVVARSSEGSRRGAQPSNKTDLSCPSLRYSRSLRARRSLVSRSSPSTPSPLGRSSSPIPQGPASSPLFPSIRSFSPGPLDDEQEDPDHNAVCYPEIVLEGPLDEDTTPVAEQGPPDALFCAWPMDPALDQDVFPDSLPYIGETDAAGDAQESLEKVETGLAQHAFWKQGAVAAVMRAEENYRRAWKELQAAERHLQSTRQVALELDAVPPSTVLTSAPQLPALPAAQHYGAGNVYAEPIRRTAGGSQEPWLGEASPGEEEAAGVEVVPVDLGFEDGVWCIEACRPDSDAMQPGQEVADDGAAASMSGAILDAEGAILRSRSALDKAAADLVARLQEEKELQGQVIDRHIEALDQGAQHQVARWLVEEMDAGGRVGRESEAEGAALAAAKDALALAVPLDLDLAMRGYDEHAMRFLCHLPYDQVLKIRTIPPSEETKSLSSAFAAASSLETILRESRGRDQGSAQQGAFRQVTPPRPDLRGGEEATGERTVDELSTSARQEGSGASGWDGSLQGDAAPVVPSVGSIVKRSGMRKGGRYHTKLVLLGCCVSSVAAYMVANFELLTLAKDVSVILAAMSLAFIAAQFVWRSGERAPAVRESSGTGSGPGTQDGSQGSSYGLRERTGGSPGLEGTLRPGIAAMYARTPSWDQIIWLLGGSAVVLSLSTMIALACKAAQAGLTALSVMACSLVVGILPNGASKAASAALLASQGSASGLVRHVSTSLWLVLGGEALSSGVECLGSAAAWAMLLLCVAFSIASAPVCIASSTSRRVNELLALARHGKGEE